MELKVESFTFVKHNGQWVYATTNKLYTLSDEMMECMERQYKMMGYMLVMDGEDVKGFGKATNEIEYFVKKMEESKK